MSTEKNPLGVFFTSLIPEIFAPRTALRDTEIQAYVIALLTEFLESRMMFKIHNALDRPLADVGEMLLESDPVYGPAPSFDREREVRKHIGDYTLFLLGMFPESINHRRLHRWRLEQAVDFMKVGRESYLVVASFSSFEHAKAAPLFSKLAGRFEECVHGLNAVRWRLDENRYPLLRGRQGIVT